MQRLAIRILSLALITVSSAAAVETKYPHGGFEPRLDKLQGLLGYVQTAKKVEVKAGPKLWQAITAIPVATGIPITPEQEADLRDWLYDFLVAFSASGNDSLAAQFYLREGVNNPRALKSIQKTLESWDIPHGDTPFDLFHAMHRVILDHQGEYCFGNAFFRHSTFKVFEMQGQYERYGSYPRNAVKSRFKLQKEVETALRAGEKRVFTDIAFVAEEPAESTGSEGPTCTPFFCRLVWDPERTMWRFVEVFYTSERPNPFLFSAI
ncbi:MAG: hypothetical protein F4Y91_13765 [Gemmatimonadetes bacterium]|nr:hypothetical protein [Gemmatimonadota bacterium]MXY83089.1 hypothetical protein [Gemmatimonadota bacterium]MYB72219.1 hypothetical protein [Gemmatimonadota bacterium]